LQLPSDGTVVATTPANLSATDTDLLNFIFRNGFEDPTLNASAGTFKLPTIALRGLLDEVAVSIYSLSDANGEALRIYGRERDGVQEFALATRDASGRWKLGEWQRFSLEPTLSWRAVKVDVGFVLQTLELK
jgi:hypothetical protein